MTTAWPEEPGYHWVTHNDGAAAHLHKAENALSKSPPDTALAQVHATLAQAEATLVVVHTLRDIMAKIREQTMAIDDLRQFVGVDDHGEDRRVDEGASLSHPGAVVDR
jgi:hypothetical protein